MPSFVALPSSGRGPGVIVLQEIFGVTDYIKQRCHYDFRWWYEYSGGRMTDWGAHHVDIAQWAVAPDLPGPTTIEPLHVDFTVPFEHGYPTIGNAFNTSPHFNIKCSFANGVDMFLRDRAEGFTSDNGILIVGDGGWLFVNREKLTGPPATSTDVTARGIQKAELGAGVPASVTATRVTR